MERISQVYLWLFLSISISFCLSFTLSDVQIIVICVCNSIFIVVNLMPYDIDNWVDSLRYLFVENLFRHEIQNTSEKWITTEVTDWKDL